MPVAINPQTNRPYTSQEAQVAGQKAYQEAYDSVMSQYEARIAAAKYDWQKKTIRARAQEEAHIYAAPIRAATRQGLGAYWGGEPSKRQLEAMEGTGVRPRYDLSKLSPEEARQLAAETEEKGGISKGIAELRRQSEQPEAARQLAAEAEEKGSMRAGEAELKRQEKRFKETHIELPGDQWVPIKDWNKLPEKYQTIGLHRGFDALFDAMTKDRATALKKAAEFKVLPTEKQFSEGKIPEGYDLEGMIAAGYLAEARILFPESKVTEARFNADWRRAYDAASPEHKFDMLKKRGDIPAAAKFDSMENDGTIHYSLPPRTVAGTGVSLTAEKKAQAEKEFLREGQRNRQTIVGIALAGLPEKTYTLEEQKEIQASQPQLWQAIKFGGRRSNYNSLDEKERDIVLSYYASLKPMKILGMTVPKGKVPETKGVIQAAKMIAGPIPGIGTYVFWNEPPIKIGPVTMPKNVERAASIIFDAAIITSIVKPGLITSIFRSATGAAKETKVVQSIYREGVNASTRALKAIDKRLVSPFKVMVKAQDDLARNLTEIRDLERTLARGAGEVASEIKRVLEIKVKQTPQLETSLRMAAKDFAKVQKNAARAAYDAMPLAQSSFADDIVRDTRSAVEIAFSEQKGVASTQREISGLLKQLERQKTVATRAARIIEASENLIKSKAVSAASRQRLQVRKAAEEQRKILTAAQRQAQTITMKLSEAQSRLLIAKSGQARRLAETISDISRELKTKQAELKTVIAEFERGITDPTREKDYEGIIRLLRKQIKNAKARLATQEGKLATAFKGMEMGWAKPLTRGGGRVITRQVPTILPRYVGGGPRVAQGPIPLISAIGVRGARATVAGEELISTEPITSPGMPDIFTFVPGKTPYPKLLVAEPTVEPAIKPKTWPAYPPIPKPTPYQEIYIIEQLKALPQIRRKVETESEAKALTQSLTAAGMSTKVATDIAQRAKTEGKSAAEIYAKILSEQESKTESKPATGSQTATKAGTKPQVKTEPKPAIMPKLRPEITTETIIDKGEIKVPPPPVPVKRDEEDEESSWTREEIKSAIAFRMGMLKRKGRLVPVTIARKEPYTPGDEQYFIGKVPQGMKVLPSVKAKETIQLLGGRYPGTIRGRVGFANYTVRGVSKRPGEAVMTFGGPSVKRGKMFYTPSNGGTLISRRPLGKRRRRA